MPLRICGAAACCASPLHIADELDVCYCCILYVLCVFVHIADAWMCAAAAFYMCCLYVQVLLSQVHRLRALLLLGKFLDMGPW